MDRIQILYGGSLCIPDDCEELIKNNMADGRHFVKMASTKACGRNILRTVDWIAFKFHVVVSWVFLIIWLTFGQNSHTKSLWAR